VSAELITMILLSVISLFSLKKGKQPEAMICVPVSISANGTKKTLECKLPLEAASGLEDDAQSVDKIPLPESSEL